MQGFGIVDGAAPPQAQGQQGAPQAQPGMQPGAQPDGGAPPMAPGSGQPATPEQQAQFDKFVSLGMVMLFDPDFIPKAREVIDHDGGPIEGVAEVATGIVSRIYTQAIKEGEKIDAQVILHGGWEIVQHVAEVAKNTVAPDMSDEDVETAFFVAADKLRSVLGRSGFLQDSPDPEQQAQQARQQVGEEQMNANVSRAQMARRNRPGEMA